MEGYVNDTNKIHMDHWNNLLFKNTKADKEEIFGIV